MDETPSDSGASPADPTPTAPEQPASAFKLPTADHLLTQIRRPAVWSLLLLIAIVLIVQIWLLFL